MEPSREQHTSSSLRPADEPSDANEALDVLSESPVFTRPAFQDPFVSSNRASGSETRSSSISTMPSGYSRAASIATSNAASSVFSHVSPTPTGITDASTSDTSLLDDRKASTSIADYVNTEGSRVAPNAVLRLGRQDIRLSVYETGTVGRTRVVIWNRGSSQQVEQRLPSGSGSFPFTKHSSLASRPNEVCFLGKHEIKHGGTVYRESPRFFFTSEYDSTTFQSAVRRRQLMQTFDVEKICTSVSSRQGEASDQHLKIWKSLTGERYYLCYFANNNGLASFREFPVRWFDRPNPNKKPGTTKTARLSFIKVKRSLSGGSRRPSSSRKLPSGIRDETGAQSPVIEDHRTSITSSSSSAVEFDDQIPSEEAIKLAYLDIEFASGEDCDDFLQVFRKSYDDSVTAAGRISPTTAPPATAKTDSQAADAPLQRATPMGLLGLKLDMAALRID